MTPFEFDILLHYYVSSAPHRVELENPPIWPETRAWLLAEGLLELRSPTESGGAYRATERAKAYIEHVLATPLPVSKWVIPDSAKE